MACMRMGLFVVCDQTQTEQTLSPCSARELTDGRALADGTGGQRNGMCVTDKEEQGNREIGQEKRKVAERRHRQAREDTSLRLLGELSAAETRVIPKLSGQTGTF